MDDHRVGRLLREVRIRKSMRQQDLAAKARVSAAQVSAAERGKLEHVSLKALRRIGDELEIRISVDAWWLAGAGDRLLDEAHAALVERTVRILRDAGWEIRVEYTFNEYGERGSVDVLGWLPEARVLLIGEIKSRIDDVQDTAASYSRKVRLVPLVVQRVEGWSPATVIRLLVLADTHQNRDVVARHATTFDSIWPERTVAMKRAVIGPGRDATDRGGIWFVPMTGLPGRTRSVARVRRARSPTDQDRPAA